MPRFAHRVVDVGEASADRDTVLPQLGDERLLDPITRGMNFFLTAQQGPPQPGWGLQYTLDVRPAGARTYEPNSLATHTTATNIGHMITFYELTGDTKFIARVPEALDWLQSKSLPKPRGDSDPRALLPRARSMAHPFDPAVARREAAQNQSPDSGTSRRAQGRDSLRRPGRFTARSPTQPVAQHRQASSDRVLTGAFSRLNPLRRIPPP